MLNGNRADGGHDYDVAICGGGLAGLTLARQLRLQLPQASVAVVEKLPGPVPEAAFKVGESTTEAGSYYLAETLQLREYLAKHHLFKLGLRFFFGNSRGAFHERPEFGLSDFPVVPSFQVDRGVLENDLRRFNAEAGVAMLEGCLVRNIALAKGEGRHVVAYQEEESGRAGRITARWVVDATGRRRLLQRKLKLTKPLDRNFSAAWFRLQGRIDVGDLVPAEEAKWHGRVQNGNRYFSTNHLVGRGYWVWVIPLSSDSTSIGIDALEDIHPFAEYSTYPAAMRWLARHEPAFATYIEGREPLDFLSMRNYSYSSRQVFSSDRWACVGEAGVFSDPLYSPGTDLIGIGNSMVTEMVRRDLAGTLTPDLVTNYSWSIISLNEALTRNIQIGYPLFSNPVVTAAKIMWDTAAGWALLSPQIFNSIFVDGEQNASIRKAKAGYFLLAQMVHRLFVEWEAKSSQRGTFDFIDFLKVPLLLDLRQRNLRGGKGAAELVDDHMFNMERIEELAQVIFLLAVEDVMPECLAQFSSPLWLNAWGISLNRDKWQRDGLFQPTTEARDLTGMRQQIRGLFRFADVDSRAMAVGHP